ncbi:MAG: hypothetical protein WCG98_06795 [bacterium]
MPTLTFQKTGLTSGVKNIKLTSVVGQITSQKLVSFTLLWKDDLSKIGTNLEFAYMKGKHLSLPASSFTKITAKTYIPQLKSYLSGMINVLLYDLSMNYHTRELTCDGICLVSIDSKITKVKTLSLESYDGFLYVPNGENYLTPAQVTVASASG